MKEKVYQILCQAFPFLTLASVPNENEALYTAIVREVSVTRTGVQKLDAYLREHTDFLSAPASTKFHGNFEGGLLEHSLNVLALLAKKNADYDLGLPMDTVVVSALFHDVCKANVYKKSTRNHKFYHEDGKKTDEGGNFDWLSLHSFEFDDGMPLGHGSKSVILLERFFRLTELEIALVLWHMGPYSTKNDWDFSGACAVYPACAAIYTADSESSFLFEDTKEPPEQCW